MSKTMSHKDFIPTFLLTPNNEDPGNSPIAILYLHANACDIAECYSVMETLSENVNANVLLMEYPGYSLLSGFAVDPHMIDEIAWAGLQHLFSLKYPSSNIIIYGRSIGTGPAARLARRTKKEIGLLGGLVLESPYSSIYEVAFKHAFILANVVGSWGWSPREDVNSISEPNLVIIHGTEDKTTPIAHARAIMDAAGGQIDNAFACRVLKVIEGGGHELDIEDISVAVAQLASFIVDKRNRQQNRGRVRRHSLDCTANKKSLKEAVSKLNAGISPSDIRKFISSNSGFAKGRGGGGQPTVSAVTNASNATPSTVSIGSSAAASNLPAKFAGGESLDDVIAIPMSHFAAGADRPRPVNVAHRRMSTSHSLTPVSASSSSTAAAIFAAVNASSRIHQVLTSSSPRNEKEDTQKKGISPNHCKSETVAVGLIDNNTNMAAINVGSPNFATGGNGSKITSFNRIHSLISTNKNLPLNQSHNMNSSRSLCVSSNNEPTTAASDQTMYNNNNTVNDVIVENNRQLLSNHHHHHLLSDNSSCNSVESDSDFQIQHINFNMNVNNRKIYNSITPPSILPPENKKIDEDSQVQGESNSLQFKHQKQATVIHLEPSYSPVSAVNLIDDTGINTQEFLKSPVASALNNSQVEFENVTQKLDNEMTIQSLWDTSNYRRKKKWIIGEVVEAPKLDDNSNDECEGEVIIEHKENTEDANLLRFLDHGGGAGSHDQEAHVFSLFADVKGGLKGQTEDSDGWMTDHDEEINFKKGNHHDKKQIHYVLHNKNKEDGYYQNEVIVSTNLSPTIIEAAFQSNQLNEIETMQNDKILPAYKHQSGPSEVLTETRVVVLPSMASSTFRDGANDLKENLTSSPSNRSSCFVEEKSQSLDYLSRVESVLGNQPEFSSVRTLNSTLQMQIQGEEEKISITTNEHFNNEDEIGFNTNVQCLINDAGDTVGNESNNDNIQTYDTFDKNENENYQNVFYEAVKICTHNNEQNKKNNFVMQQQQQQQKHTLSKSPPINVKSSLLKMSTLTENSNNTSTKKNLEKTKSSIINNNSSFYVNTTSSLRGKRRKISIGQLREIDNSFCLLVDTVTSLSKGSNQEFVVSKPAKNTKRTRPLKCIQDKKTIKQVSTVETETTSASLDNKKMKRDSVTTISETKFARTSLPSSITSSSSSPFDNNACRTRNTTKKNSSEQGAITHKKSDEKKKKLLKTTDSRKTSSNKSSLAEVSENSSTMKRTSIKKQIPLLSSGLKITEYPPSSSSLSSPSSPLCLTSVNPIVPQLPNLDFNGLCNHEKLHFASLQHNNDDMENIPDLHSVPGSVSHSAPFQYQDNNKDSKNIKYINGYSFNISPSVACTPSLPMSSADNASFPTSHHLDDNHNNTRFCHQHYQEQTKKGILVAKGALSTLEHISSLSSSTPSNSLLMRQNGSQVSPHALTAVPILDVQSSNSGNMQQSIFVPPSPLKQGNTSNHNMKNNNIDNGLNYSLRTSNSSMNSSSESLISASNNQHHHAMITTGIKPLMGINNSMRQSNHQINLVRDFSSGSPPLSISSSVSSATMSMHQISAVKLPPPLFQRRNVNLSVKPLSNIVTTCTTANSPKSSPFLIHTNSNANSQTTKDDSVASLIPFMTAVQSADSTTSSSLNHRSSGEVPPLMPGLMGLSGREIDECASSAILGKM